MMAVLKLYPRGRLSEVGLSLGLFNSVSCLTRCSFLQPTHRRIAEGTPSLNGHHKDKEQLVAQLLEVDLASGGN